MKSRFIRRLALLAVILVTAWVFAPKPDRPPVEVPVSPAEVQPPTAATSSSQTLPPAPSPVGSADAAPPSTPPAPAPATSPPSIGPGPDAAAAIAVDGIRRMLRDYRTLTGENPVGTNAEIMRTLMGDNPRQATLGPPEGQSLNDQGELVDRWGTPVFFHQLSKTLMEIRSAGPDRTLWTEDDIVAR